MNVYYKGEKYSIPEVIMNTYGIKDGYEILSHEVYLDLSKYFL